MKKLIIILPILLLLLGSTFIEQTTCLKSKLVGEWKIVSTMHYTESTNIDSFINSVNDSTKTRATWTFNEDGTEIYVVGKHTSKATYTIDEKKCELIINGKHSYSKKKIIPIIYLDDKYLFLKIHNPHYDSTYFLIR